MRLTFVLCVIIFLVVRELSAAHSLTSTLGYAATLVVCACLSLCYVGLELLSFVLLATYVVVFLILFVVVLGWRGSSFNLRTESSPINVIFILLVSCVALSILSSFTVFQHFEHQLVTHSCSVSAAGVSQVTFAQVLQSLFVRFFLAEVIALNVILLCGFQLVSLVLSSLWPSSSPAVASVRVRRAWRRAPASRHV
jgi:hypothetical protein